MTNPHNDWIGRKLWSQVIQRLGAEQLGKYSTNSWIKLQAQVNICNAFFAVGRLDAAFPDTQDGSCIDFHYILQEKFAVETDMMVNRVRTAMSMRCRLNG
jgi:hypothetical protein